MSRNRTRKDLGTTIAPTTPHLSPESLAARLLQHPARTVRQFAQLTPQRKTFAAVLCAASIAGLGCAVTVQSMHAAHVAPLAPPPGPLKAAAALAAAPKVQPKHHLLAALAAVNPLHGVNALRGMASWYGAMWHGRPTASGELFDESLMTACHRTLPFGTLVRVTDEVSTRSVVVRINDRGTLTPDRVIDLSAAAATQLGMLRTGVAHVHLEVLKAIQPKHDTESNRID